MKKTVIVAMLLASSMIGGVAQAAISLGPTVNGIATFTDSNTGRNWARLNSFFNLSHNAMATEITGKGFVVAIQSDVEALVATLPLDGGQWSDYAAIMGSSPNRDLIWGSLDPVDGDGNITWTYAYGDEIIWTTANELFPADAVAVADMNIWAYVSGDAVPEPTSWALMIAGFGLVGAAMRRRARVAA